MMLLSLLCATVLTVLRCLRCPAGRHHSIEAMPVLQSVSCTVLPPHQAHTALRVQQSTLDALMDVVDEEKMLILFRT